MRLRSILGMARPVAGPWPPKLFRSDSEYRASPSAASFPFLTKQALWFRPLLKRSAYR